MKTKRLLPKLSLLVGLKNNLDYTRNFYSTTRELDPDVEIVFVSYGSTDGTHAWLDQITEVDPNVIIHWSEELKTFSDTFNKATEIATGDYVIYLHNDIVLCPSFLMHMQESTKEDLGNLVISYTTIEPPIFNDHSRPGKIIKDFGSDLETFDKKAFHEYTQDKEIDDSEDPFFSEYSEGSSFFLMMWRDNLLDIGGLDNLFSPMFCEDDDLLKRLKLAGYRLVTSNKAMVYHFVSKTSRFSEEYQNKTQEIEKNSQKNYLRKWHSNQSKGRYDIGFVINGEVDHNILTGLEILCDNMYILPTRENDKTINQYIMLNQPITKFDLMKKFIFNEDLIKNEVIVYIDLKMLSNDSYNQLLCLPLALDEILTNNVTGSFNFGPFIVNLTKPLVDYSSKYISNNIYT